MKKHKMIRSLIALCIGLLILIYLVSMYHPRIDFEVSRRFTFVSPLSLWSNIATGIVEADDDFQTQTKLMGSEKLDIKKQVKAIEETILTKPDGIITAASEEADELREAILNAVSLNIPVVLVDSDLPDSERSCYIGTDNYAAGEMAGKDMVEATGGKANIGIVVSDLTYPNQRERVDGFNRQISQYDDMEITAVVECHSQKLELLEKIPEMLEENPQIDALFLSEAIASAVIGDMINDSHTFSGLTIIGFDLTEEAIKFIEDGTYYSVITQDPIREGYLAVQTLCQLINGESVEDVIHTPVYSITAENLTDHDVLINEDLKWYLY